MAIAGQSGGKKFVFNLGNRRLVHPKQSGQLRLSYVGFASPLKHGLPDTRIAFLVYLATRGRCSRERTVSRGFRYQQSVAAL
jgi:hypothetical protein